MSTPLELAFRRELSRFNPNLDDGEAVERSLYGLPALRRWIEDTLPSLESTWNVEDTPAEQLDALLADYCSGEPMAIDLQFKNLIPVGDGIWELKTADLRMFGWFHRKDCFIGSSCDSADRIKEYKLYNGYIAEAVRRRDALDLDVPKFVPGDNAHDVISNCYFP